MSTMVLSKASKFLFPNTIETYNSQYNGEVMVVEQFGQRKIYAGGLLQSGSIIKDLWQKPLKSVGVHHDVPLQILILGFGGGTAAQLLFKKFPNAQITGIEIDPVMIVIYEKYFRTVRNNNSVSLQLIQSNCFHWIQNCNQKYDLVLVDLYQGHEIPKQLYQTQFLDKIRHTINPQGQLLVNHLFFDQYKQKVPKLIKQLEKHFSDIKLIRNLSNMFVLCK